MAMQKKTRKINYNITTPHQSLEIIGMGIPKEPFYASIGFFKNPYPECFHDCHSYMILTDPYIQKIEGTIHQDTTITTINYNISLNTDCGIPCLVILDNTINQPYSLYYCTLIESVNLPILVFTNNIIKLYSIEKKYIYGFMNDIDFMNEIVEVVTCENIFNFNDTNYCIPILDIDTGNLVQNISDLYYEFNKLTFISKDNNEKEYEYYLPSIFDITTYINENLEDKTSFLDNFIISKTHDMNIFYNYLTYIKNINEQINTKMGYRHNCSNWISPYYTIATDTNNLDSIWLLSRSRLTCNNTIFRDTCITDNNNYIRYFLTDICTTSIHKVEYNSWYDNKGLNILNFIRDARGASDNHTKVGKDIVIKLYRYIVKRFLLQDEYYRFNFDKGDYSLTNKEEF